MSDAECWKLNRMRQLEDENIGLFKRISELEAERDANKDLSGILSARIIQLEAELAAAKERERELIREGFEAAFPGPKIWRMRKVKKCDECFEKKEDVKKREYEDGSVMLCDECYEQNIGYGQQEKSSSSPEK